MPHYTPTHASHLFLASVLHFSLLLSTPSSPLPPLLSTSASPPLLSIPSLHPASPLHSPLPPLCSTPSLHPLQSLLFTSADQKISEDAVIIRSLRASRNRMVIAIYISLL